MRELSPSLVWGYFEEITKIPRPSKKEELIREYLRNFATARSLPFKEDQYGNIVITRPAAEGCEHKETTILQSHVDMVCEKEAGLEFDFQTMPIDAYIDGEWIKARGTTLGADCGIGMALQMAALTDPELHTGAIEALFTVDEEQGLTGAMNLGQEMLTGSRMINLDSEDEGEIYIGCAGGVDTVAVFDAELKKAPSKKDYSFYRITVGGLKGGHSGDDINKGLANAIKVLTRELWALMSNWKVRLCHIDGGNLRNAIPRDAYAVVALPKDRVEEIIIYAAELAASIKAEFAMTEPDMAITMRDVVRADSKIDTQASHLLIAALTAVPHGVQAMSSAIPGLVETSTNLASVKMVKDEIVVTTSQRSSVESAKHDIATTVESVFRLAGATINHSDGYPGWAPNVNSALLHSSKQVYAELFGREPAIKAIHAGLECGLFLKMYPNLDIISIGPTLRGVHSPAERLEIASVEQVWRFLATLLSR